MKEIGAAGFGWVQLPAPPESVLVDPRSCIRHARGAGDAVAGAGLRCVLHAPAELIAGRPETDRAVEGAIAYAAECGAAAVVLHARAYGDGPGAGDRALAETRSLARIALIAERLGVTLALENLAPVYPGPETISANPLSLRALARRIASPAVGLCLDVGHANVIAGLRRTSLSRMVEPVLDMVALLHVHDNLGARWIRDERPESSIRSGSTCTCRPAAGRFPGRQWPRPSSAPAPPLSGRSTHRDRQPAEIMDAARNAMEATPKPPASQPTRPPNRPRRGPSRGVSSQFARFHPPTRNRKPQGQAIASSSPEWGARWGTCALPHRSSGAKGQWRGPTGRPPERSGGRWKAGRVPAARPTRHDTGIYVCLTMMLSIELLAARQRSMASSSAA